MNLTRKEPTPVTKEYCIMCDKEIKPQTLDSIFFYYGMESLCAKCQTLKNEARRLTDLVNANLPVNEQEDVKDAFLSEQHFYEK